METILASTRSQIAKRRSSRIGLNTNIGVSGFDVQNCPFTMPAKATNLNRYGAAIYLTRQLSVGSTVNIRNARGGQVSARVVAQVAVSQGISVYGIEFIEPGNSESAFWGITFPSLQNRPLGAQAPEHAGIARRRRGVSPVHG